MVDFRDAADQRSIPPLRKQLHRCYTDKITSFMLPVNSTSSMKKWDVPAGKSEVKGEAEELLRQTEEERKYPHKKCGRCAIFSLFSPKSK
jgi:hypothetical protein